MLAQDIISKFELYVDDTTELSTTEEYALLNKIYYQVCSERPWEFLKTEASGTMTSTTTITLPSDFEYFVENYNYTDNAYSTQVNSRPCAIFIDTNKVFKIVNWADRRQYVNTNQVAYLDLANSLIRFPVAQSASSTYSFDYKKTPTALTVGSTPVIPTRFQDILTHGMAVDDMIIQQFPKAQSYAAENQAKYNQLLSSMSFWNAKLSMN